jgi:hypothetical protein
MITTPLAPIDMCGNTLAANEIHVSCSRRLVSPNGRWQVVIKGEDGPAPNVRIDRRLLEDGAVVANREGHAIAVFDMERDARLYWLKDGRHLIVNYFAGSDSTRPLVIGLTGAKTKPVDLSELIFPDVLKRIHKRARQVYHYYVWFVSDDGPAVTIAAEPEYVLKGNYGPGGGTCLIYSVDKITFHGYHFVREVHDTDKCPKTSRNQP